MNDFPGEYPMNRWYVSRWLFRTTADDFKTAVQSTHEAMEHMAKRKFDLKVTFYRAADPAALKFPDAPAPDIVVKTVDRVDAIRNRDWHNAHRVEAELTARPLTPGSLPIPPIYSHAKISAGWPDARRIDFEVQPQHEARQLSRFLLDTNFTLWTRGYDFR